MGWDWLKKAHVATLVPLMFISRLSLALGLFAALFKCRAFAAWRWRWHAPKPRFEAAAQNTEITAGVSVQQYPIHTSPWAIAYVQTQLIPHRN